MLGETLHTMFSRIPVKFQTEDLWDLNGIPQGLIQIIERVLLGNDESDSLEMGRIKKFDTKTKILRIKSTQEIKES